MDGNLGMTPPPDRVVSRCVRGIGGGGGAAVWPRGGARDYRGTASKMVDSASMEWTDEKHSLYLNAMEASFINQLYSCEFNSNGMWGWTQKINKDTDSQASNSQKTNSGQFKVLRGGCWGRVKFEGQQTRTGVRNESRVLSRNPWIHHFMSAINNKSLDLSSEHVRGCQAVSPEIHIGQRHDVAALREATGSIMHLDYCPHLCHLDSVGSNAEVSDQNFVDDIVGSKQPRRAHKKKRHRTTVSDTRDQLAPFGKTPAISGDYVDLASPIEKDAEHGGAKAAKHD